MNKIAWLCLFTISMSGCSAVNYFTMARFDSVEYMLANAVTAAAAVGESDCGTNKAKKSSRHAWESAVELSYYTVQRKNNQQAAAISQEILSQTAELYQRYQEQDSVSKSYCEIKFSNIKKNSVLLQSALGNKPK